MNTYVVLLREPNRVVAQRIEDTYVERHRFKLSSTAYFVADEGAVTADVARNVGLKGADRVESASGLVMRVTAYSGWTVRTLWEWLMSVESD